MFGQTQSVARKFRENVKGLRTAYKKQCRFGRE